MAKYLISGITSHLGPHLANILLANDHEVVGMHRRTNGSEIEIVDVVGDNLDKIKFIYGDILDLPGLNKIFANNKFDGIFHLSAQSNPGISANEPVATMFTNVMGTANLIQAISDNQPEAKLLFVSTSECYGNSIKEGESITEDHYLEAANPYSASKIASDIYLQERMRNGKIRGVITRAFSHFAPRRGRNFSISSDCYQLVKMKLGKQEKVLKVGNLNTIRVVIDGRDVADAYYRLMINDKSDGQVFNVCGTEPHKMQFYTDLLIKAVGFEPGEVKQEIYKPYWRDAEIFYQKGDPSKLKKLTGWEPKISIEQSCQDLVDYWMKKLS